MHTRLSFSFIHLLISFLITSLTLIIIFLLWYPAPLAKAVGVTPLVLIMLTINVIFGPALVFFIYKQGKKSLKFDLSIIISLQICAFCYGIYSIADGRPAWLVYSVDRIELIQNNDISLLPGAKIKPKYQFVSWLNPQYVSVNLSNNPDQKEKDMLNAIFGLTLAKQPNRYTDFSDAKLNIQKNAQALAVLNHFNQSKLVQDVLKDYPQANAWIPLKAKLIDMVVLVNKNTGEVIKIVDLRPWK